MSEDGRSLMGNELSHYPKGTCLLLLLFRSMQCGSFTIYTGMFLCMRRQIWRKGSWKRWRLALSNIIILLHGLLLQIAEVKQEAVSTECQSGFTLHTDIHPMSLP